MTLAEFTGGMNVPYRRFGRMNASTPMGRLSISPTEVAIGLRGMAWAVSDYVVQLTDIAVAYPLRGRWFFAGVGLQMTDGTTAYFFLKRDRDQLLQTLTSVGVPVDLVPRGTGAQWQIFRKQTVGQTPRLLPGMVLVWAAGLLLAGLLLTLA